MGDTYRDPVDHLRTTRPLAGESLIDVVHWPGYLLIVAGVVGGVGALAAFGTGHHAEGMTFGVVAIVVTVVGLAWLAFEHRRIRKIADRWYTELPKSGGSGWPARHPSAAGNPGIAGFHRQLRMGITGTP